MTIGTRLFTFFRGKPVGVDSFGNRYYKARRGFGPRAERRWVIYKGAADASAIPPQWHAWIHYTSDQVPLGTGPSRPWQKPHRSNPTGTALAYRPPGHALSGGQRAKATGDYEPWQPV